MFLKCFKILLIFLPFYLEVSKSILSELQKESITHLRNGLANFLNKTAVLVQMRKVLHAGCLLLPPNRKHSSDPKDPAFFYINPSRFSPKNVKNFHGIFNSPSLSKLFLSFFDKFLD